MKVVFMGTPDIAAATLKELVNTEHTIVAVFTQPDKPKGRGQKVLFSPVKEVATAHNIPVYQPEKLRGNEEMLTTLKELKADIAVVVAYGQILPKVFLDTPKYGCINTHASLLPKYRGAAPIQRAIIEGENESGVTIMQMSEGLDTGDILLQLKIEIDDSTTSAELFRKMEQLCIEGVTKTLHMIEKGEVTPIKQDDNLATWAKPLEKSEGKIDFSKPTSTILRQIHGLNPWPVAFTVIGGKNVKVYTAKRSDLSGDVGELLDKNRLIIGTKDGAVELLEVVPEGKKRTEGSSLINGMRLIKNEIVIGE